MKLEHLALILLSILLLSSLLANFYFFSRASELADGLSGAQNSIKEMQGNITSLRSNYSMMSSLYYKSQYELSATKSDLATTKANLNLTQTSLNERSSQLERSNSQLSQTRTNLTSAQVKISSISTELSSLEENINSSMSWFKENAQLPENYSRDVSTFMERVSIECIDANTLNAACIAYRLETNALSLTYKRDSEIGRADFLQPLKYTIRRGGGDCEDYALFVKAILNSLRTSYKKPLSLFGWAPAQSGEFRVYPPVSAKDTDVYYYYKNARKAQLGDLSTANLYVVCYPLTSAEGHCTLAVSPIKINASSQLNLLVGSEVFEPQNGMYLGTIGREFSICDTPNTQRCYGTSNIIVTVIADDELYQVFGSKWTGYADYKLQIDELKGTLGTQ